ncbi:MAG: hypothetical protein JSV16_00660 [Candidatus Hydrogenedentota bacterium]|nr:MAG: hypothetical protein JSV16_00660 [Candidatus Hydrogenedentota bacterium]
MAHQQIPSRLFISYLGTGTIPSWNDNGDLKKGGRFNSVAAKDVRYDPRMRLTVPDSALPYYRIYEIEVRDTLLGASRPDPRFHCGFTAEKSKKIRIYRRPGNPPDAFSF